MYIYILEDGKVRRSLEFDNEIAFIECLRLYDEEVQEYVGGEWLDVLDLGEEPSV